MPGLNNAQNDLCKYNTKEQKRNMKISTHFIVDMFDNCESTVIKKKVDNTSLTKVWYTTNASKLENDKNQDYRPNRLHKASTNQLIMKQWYIFSCVVHGYMERIADTKDDKNLKSLADLPKDPF
uniref:Uncharacterized protein n=1 Tax=Romanomermis culicivorax TaxID=13658 RepID=A0A915ITR3_ROMCU